MQYARKLGASALVVAAAFAVAFAVLLSSTSTDTVEAAEVTLSGDTADVEPGDTVIIPGQSSATIVNYAIVAGTATGSFAVGGGQTLSCSDSTTGRGCDTNTAATAISVKLNVDADSPDGYIQVTRTQVLPVPSGTGVETLVITVTTQPRPASITLSPSKTTIDANSAASDTSVITATIKFDKTPNATANAGETLTFITTLGSFTTCGTETVNTQVCADVALPLVDTDSDGTIDAARVTVTLSGANREGTAVITANHSSLDSESTDITLFGDAQNLAVEAEQGSVERGGSVFVVLTVTDNAGNPVAGAQPVAGETEVVPPEDGNPVTTGKADPFSASADVTSPYNVDKNVDNTASKSIPACGDDTADISDDSSNVQLFATADSGTNGKGQCVVKVTAPADDTATSGTNEAAARGEHTINFALGATLKQSVTITVAGPAATIESDAPEYVDPLSDTTITLTVRDDEGVLAGETAINVIKVAGAGLTEGKATKMNALTVNGSSTFSYAAGLEGQVVFRVIAGSGEGAVRDIIQLTVGSPSVDCEDGSTAPTAEECPVVEEPGPVVEEEPEEPASPWVTNDPSGTTSTLAVFGGGSVDELAAALAASCSDAAVAVTVYVDNSPLNFAPNVPVAAVNAGFNAHFAGGIPASTPLWVTNCGAAMDDGMGGMEETGNGMEDTGNGS